MKKLEKDVFMVDKVNIELDAQFLTKFFALTDRIIPDDQEITLLMLKNNLNELESMLNEAREAAAEVSKPTYVPPSFTDANAAAVSAPTDYFDSDSDGDTFNLPKKNVLIIDDLGVITYQLSVMFERLGFRTLQSKEIYDAIEKFKKQNFDLVIMDLFIPTEREGFILLEELKKTAMGKQKPTKIGVMSASGKREYKQMCKIKGAEFYIEKIDDWQKELSAIIGGLKL